MLKKFFKDESGQGMVEYALIIALIAVVVIVLGGGIKDTFNGAKDELNKATTAAAGGGH